MTDIPRSAHAVLRDAAENGWKVHAVTGRPASYIHEHAGGLAGARDVFVLQISRPESHRVDIAAVWHGGKFYAWITEAALQPWRKVIDLRARLTYPISERNET